MRLNPRRCLTLLAPLALSLALPAGAALAQAGAISGIVYVDSNGNGPRAALGFTLILLSALGLLILQRARLPDTGGPVGISFAQRDPPVRQGPRRLFEVPHAPCATRESEFALARSAPTPYLLYSPRSELYAPVATIHNELKQIGDQAVWQLSQPPAYAVGWSAVSARVGQPGNTVFVGRNNEFGDVFRDLNTLAEGDELYVRTNELDRRYLVSETALFEEEYRPLEERVANARWIAPSPGERLTLITCWPYFTNTHRIVVVALPAD